MIISFLVRVKVKLIIKAEVAARETDKIVEIDQNKYPFIYKMKAI